MSNNQTSTAKRNPNANLQLDFDYKNLKGDEFKRYLDYCESIVPATDIYSAKEFVFEKRKAKPIFVERYPGLSGTPVDFIGIELGLDNGVPAPPIMTTQIPFKIARDHNEQILNAHSRAGHGTYFLLKKN